MSWYDLMEPAGYRSEVTSDQGSDRGWKIEGQCYGAVAVVAAAAADEVSPIGPGPVDFDHFGYNYRRYAVQIALGVDSIQSRSHDGCVRASSGNRVRPMLKDHVGVAVAVGIDYGAGMNDQHCVSFGLGNQRDHR